MNYDKLKEKYKRTKIHNKIKLSSQRVKSNSANQDEEDNNASSYANTMLEDAVSKTSATAKDLTVRRIKDRAYNKKLSTGTYHTTPYSEKGRAFAVDTIRRKTSSNQYTVKSFIKNITEGGLFKHTTAFKPMFTDNKVLTAVLFDTGGVAVISVILVCLIALMTGSPFGVFMSTEDTGTGYTLVSVVQDINAEYLAEIEKIKMDNPHDSFEMERPLFNWKEILAVYSVIVSGYSDAVTFDENKADLLKEVFWTFTDVEYEITQYEDIETTLIYDDEGNRQEQKTIVVKTKLTMQTEINSLADVRLSYGFNASQTDQLNEILSEDNQSLWDDIVYMMPSVQNAGY